MTASLHTHCQALLFNIPFAQSAGMISKVFEHPFDLVKVRLQSQPLDEPAKYKGPIDCLAQTFRGEGFRGLYRVRSLTF